MGGCGVSFLVSFMRWGSTGPCCFARVIEGNFPFSIWWGRLQPIKMKSASTRQPKYYSRSSLLMPSAVWSPVIGWLVSGPAERRVLLKLGLLIMWFTLQLSPPPLLFFSSFNLGEFLFSFLESLHFTTKISHWVWVLIWYIWKLVMYSWAIQHNLGINKNLRVCFSIL